MKEIVGQLTLRGVIIGCCGCAIVTASSAYVALRVGALPWPIIFAAIVSLYFLKVVSRNSSTLNEANVTHTIMSAGAMVAGGLAFTIPGAWMLGFADEISLVEMSFIALAGVILGLAGTCILRRHFIEDADLRFPIGEAAARALIAGESGDGTGRMLFGSMGVAGLFAFLRDGLSSVPSMLAALPIPGVSFGIYASPMMLAVGFLVGTGSVAVWFAGALLANFGIVVGGTHFGFFDIPAAQGIVSSLGMGVMMGSGFAVVTKNILPRSVSLVRRRASEPASKLGGKLVFRLFAKGPACAGSSQLSTAGALVLGATAVALLVSMLLDLGPAVSVFVVLMSFVTCAMSAQSVGQTGIDPMEIFGLIVLLLVATFADVAKVQLFFIAAIIAVACGLAGDVMNDFKAGHIIGTSPRAQIAGQAVGGVVGAVVAVSTMHVLLSVYGAEAFGPQGSFAAAQASVVATMISGVPHAGAFAVGLAAGFTLYLAGIPSMMFGLGIYLPFYMSLTAFLGALCKMAFDAAISHRLKKRGLSGDELRERKALSEESGLIVASGLLGGESVVGIVLAMAVAFAGLLG
ncbi:MAG: OPT/YSL family transporter [Eggerthellaceae bacterium]|nr:OPT/YSL family transporter [Eggerthellaceae bacterium]